MFPAPTFATDGRSTQPEVMDGPEVSAADYGRCLRDLAQVNTFTFTHRPLLAWLERVVPRDRPVRILDVAFGQGDLLRAIARWARARGLAVTLEGIDLNPRSAAQAREATPPELDITYFTGDVFSHAPEVRPDFIVSSQFAHHLDDLGVLRLVQWLDANAACGWLLTDLERSRLAYRGFPLLCALAGWHDIVRRDGMVSIARSLRAPEWEALLSRADVRAQVRRQFPFRLTVESAQRRGVAVMTPAKGPLSRSASRPASTAHNAEMTPSR